MTSGSRKTGTTAGAGTAFSANGIFSYGYDPIGNRTDSNVDSANPDRDYTRNSVNQYTATTGPTESFTYDDDGNLTADGKYSYTWDAENRLAAIGPVSTAVVNDKKLEFKYDYMGRRVEKVYSIYNGTSWVEQNKQRFVYDDWNVVLVLDGSDNVKQKYTWGLDLSGLAGDSNSSGIHGAGGIGGLLAAVETTGAHQGTYWFTYDGNGNVGQVLNATSPASITIAAHYEYDPYGNVIYSSGTYAAANPFRFSTKWLDTELAGWNINGAVGSTGLYYYGYRYCSSGLGRWMSRDPIEEVGGLGIYVFVGNGPVDHIDILGKRHAPGCCGASFDSCMAKAKKDLTECNQRSDIFCVVMCQGPIPILPPPGPVMAKCILVCQASGRLGCKIKREIDETNCWRDYALCVGN